MKKFLIIPLMLLTIAMSACGGSNEEEVQLPETPSVPSDSNSTENSDKSDNSDSSDNSDNSNDNNGNDDNNDNQTTLTMKITIGNRIITATMEDNDAAKDLLSRLPLEITLEDFHNITEKIFYPDPALNTTGVKGGCAPVPGDITIYAPWKNVAIFCKNWSHSNELIKIGHIDGNGIEALQVAGDIKVKFEK